MNIGDVAQWKSVPFAYALGSNPNISNFNFIRFSKPFPKNQKNSAWIVKYTGEKFKSQYLQILFYPLSKPFPKNQANAAETLNRSEYRGCSSVVEHPFRIGKALGSNPNILHILFHPFSKPFPKPKECSFDRKTKKSLSVGDVAQW
jgi:hypothetical protein